MPILFFPSVYVTFFLVQTSPTLFPSSHHEKWYTLDAYHRAGSRILSRSFTVSRWTDDKVDEDEDRSETDEGGSGANEAESPNSKTSIESSMYTGGAHTHLSLFKDTNEELDSDSEDDENQDSSDVAMVPMADLLNARWGSENVRAVFPAL